MINVYQANERFSVDMGWAKSFPSFSFGAYFDLNNTAFGVMRVCNDDEIHPGKGFGPHPHNDMEVVTIVLEGQIRHEDHLGHRVVTPANGVQRMSAGTGIVHAEYNASDTETLRSLQLWFMPRERGLTPSFESRTFDPNQWMNQLLPVVTPAGSDQAVSINQDMTIYLSQLEQGKRLQFQQERNRLVFLFVLEGQLKVNDTTLNRRDSARIQAIEQLDLNAETNVFFMLIDLP